MQIQGKVISLGMFTELKAILSLVYVKFSPSFVIHNVILWTLLGIPFVLMPLSNFPVKSLYPQILPQSARRTQS
jgi:hypothetical protein